MSTIFGDDDGYAGDYPPLVGLDPKDERFATNERRVLAGCDVEEWLRLFDEHGVPAGEIMSLICAVEHPELGEIRLPGPPIQFGRSTSRGMQPRRCSMSLARRSGNG